MEDRTNFFTPWPEGVVEVKNITFPSFQHD